jgi:small subunit ribosomal protein S8
MTMTDPVGDLLTRIRNGQRANKSAVTAPSSKLRASVLEVLKREGYIRGYETEEYRDGLNQLRVELKYHEGAPVIRHIQRVSKPGRRVYSKIKDLPSVYNGLGISILSTPQGVMSDNEARAANVGGEVICEVF